VSDRPKLLDLCCGAGGSAEGYARAGFDVTGVDVVPQPHYSYRFIEGDALLYLTDYGEDYDAIHASWPCQKFTAYRRRGDGVGDGYPDLIAEGRTMLKATGRPYVLENVVGAPLRSPVQLCGSSFGLDVRRHRLFETNWPLTGRHCDHGWQTPRFPQATNRVNLRSTVEVGVRRIPLDVQKRAMGVDWTVTREELSQAVPPAFTRFIGEQLMGYISAEATA
jgi:DNA (cytosine-5)-methyltransferase 1